MYENIKLEKFDQNVLNSFRYSLRPDGSLLLVRFEDENIAKLEFKEVYTSSPCNKQYLISIDKENRAIESIAQVIRTSQNCYIVIASNKEKTEYKRCANIQAISDFLKASYCRTLF